MDPFVSFKSFELEQIPPEPFVAVNVPKLEATSQISEKPLRYSAVIRVSAKGDQVRIVENQTIDGYFVAAVAHDGVLLATPNRVIVLVVP
jgi:flagella basal body P-ring formation protein FlgA